MPRGVVSLGIGILLTLAVGCGDGGGDNDRPSDAELSEIMRSEMAADAEEERREDKKRREYRRKLERLEREAERAHGTARRDPTEVNELRYALAWSRYNLLLTYHFESDGYDCPPRRPIKGNISLETGEYIFHKPMWLYYGQTIPEECFKTAEQARKRGFRPSKVRR